MEQDRGPKQYVAALREQKSRLGQALAYKGQKPPVSTKSSRQALEQEFSLAAMQANMYGSHAWANIRSSFIGAAYPPCTLPLSSLIPIPLRDLRLETQHRGRVLIVRAFSVPNAMISIQNAVEDEHGDVERLAIYNLLPTATAEAVLPRDAIVAIKEPYYKRTADGGLIVRVDHPTDFVRLKPGSNMIPPRLAARATKTIPSALHLKEDGNAAFKRGDFEGAVGLYSDALEASGSGDDGIRQDLLRNRAGANLRLGRYELAITDALASIIPAEDTSEAARNANVKAFYRAGRAAYEMQDFSQAKQHFAQALELDRDHKQTRAEHARTENRISEQENGNYDFSKMAKSATMQHTRLDHASFLRRTRIAPTESRGRGLFATEALKPGDVVFAEKAFHTAHYDGVDSPVVMNSNTDRVSGGTQNLLCGIIDKMIWNPALASKYLDLSDGGKFGCDKEAKVVDGRVAVDTFQVQAISELNGFGCPRVRTRDKKQSSSTPEADYKKSSGIWLRAAYASHACLPNATRTFIGDMMIVRAARDMAAGEEIFMTYTKIDQPFSERQRTLRDSYGFDCDCALCRAEDQELQVAAEKRARLRREVKSFLAANEMNDGNVRSMPAATQAKARTLLEQIREAYPKAAFERLPRLDCVRIGFWVANAALIRRPEEDLRRFLGILRDLGYFVTIQGSHAVVDRAAPVQMEIGIHAAMYAAQCLDAVGRKSTASGLEALGKELFIAVRGVEDGYAAEFEKNH